MLVTFNVSLTDIQNLKRSSNFRKRCEQFRITDCWKTLPQFSITNSEADKQHCTHCNTVLVGVEGLVADVAPPLAEEHGLFIEEDVALHPLLPNVLEVVTTLVLRPHVQCALHQQLAQVREFTLQWVNGLGKTTVGWKECGVKGGERKVHS